MRVGLALAAAAALAACGGGGTGEEITVLAAASLTDALTELAGRFEAIEDVDVALRFAASSALVVQANEGAPVDVVVTADESTMAAVEGAGSSTIIARNRLAIIVEPGNPKAISGLADLAGDDVVLVLCAPEVPCGLFGDRALGAAGVEVEAASREENVKGVVAKVVLGEADAGIVYATDVRAAGEGAEGIEIDGDGPVYPMAVLERSDRPALARAWIDFVAGPAGRAVLDDHGFLAP